MFTKLRNRIILFSMLFTSALIIASFIVIYILTGGILREKNFEKLQELSALNKIHERGLIAASSQSLKEAEKPLDSDGVMSFTIMIDRGGKYLKTFSASDLPEETYRAAYREVMESPSVSGEIRLNKKTWRYINTVFATDGSISREITFLDATESLAILQRLRLILGAGVFILIGPLFFIKRFFAEKIVRPVALAWQRQQQFIADASHELKTPLAVIQANYDMILLNPDETVSEQQQWLEYMKAGMDRMYGLIMEMLDLASFEVGSPRLNIAQFNISARLAKVLNALKASADEKLLEISARIEPGIIISSDSEAVARVFTILLENAIKYARPCSQIRICAKSAKRHVVCSVTNTGEAISPKDLPNVFDRFYRSDASRARQSGGYGLGLSIAKQKIDQLGGKIMVSCNENRETTFTFMLKLNNASALEGESGQNGESASFRRERGK
ncbi:MAG: HAMP domain-containing histidine kinase [Clostridiales bacterium]|jgi:signal transduction histidine kinase|nr:HAMP domain-containing histidine kinase [Clostridiales bacterium]